MPESQCDISCLAVDALPTPSTTQCEIITDFRTLEGLWSGWQQQAQRSRRADVFQQPGWARAFWRTYGANLSVYSPVVYREGIVIGILPLVRKGKVIEFLGVPDSDYNDILCNEQNAPVALEAALSSLLQSQANWESCTLDNLSSDSRIVQYWRMLPSWLRRHLQLVFRYPAPTILFDEKREEIFDKLCGKERHPHHKKLQKSGRLTFRHLETREEAHKHLDVFFDQHITRWAMYGMRSVFLQPDMCNFYKAMIEELDPRTELRFGVVELNSEPIAYHLGFQIDGKFTLYRPTFNVHYWDSSPGDILLRSLFQYARGAGVREFDFSIGDEPYKYRYANHIKQNYVLYVDRRPARFKSRIWSLVRHGEHIVRQRPTLRRPVKHAVQCLKRIISRTTGNPDALLRWCAGLVRMMYRWTVWRHENVLVFSSRAQPADARSGVEIIPVNLDFLARLSLRYPQFLTEEKLRDSRARLKSGDLAYLVRRGDQKTSVLWLGMRSEISVAEIAPDFRLSLVVPALVIYRVWTPPHFRPTDVSSEFFDALAKYCEREVWTYCLGRQRTLLRALENAGFQARYRVQHYALLHWFQRTQISSLDGMA